MDIASLKSMARESLKNNWPTLILVAIFVIIVTGDASNSNTYIRNGVEFEVKKNYGNILNLIFGGPVALGVANIYLELIKNKKVKIERFFDGFKNFVNAFILNILATLFIVLWAIAFVIPGIIAAINYSMAYFIMSEQPNISAMDAIKKSKLMMSGHKMEYFSFVMSFFGWFLLGLITLGLGFLFLYPYFAASKAYFYQNLKGEDYIYSDEYIVESKKE